MAKRISARNNSSGEARYGVTHAFELKTAETLGRFEEQLRQHTAEIGNIDTNIKAWDVRFVKLEAGLESIRVAITNLQNPVIVRRDDMKTLVKYAVTFITSGTVLAYIWDFIMHQFPG